MNIFNTETLNNLFTRYPSMLLSHGTNAKMTSLSNHVINSYIYLCDAGIDRYTSMNVILAVVGLLQWVAASTIMLIMMIFLLGRTFRKGKLCQQCTNFTQYDSSRQESTLYFGRNPVYCYNTAYPGYHHDNVTVNCSVDSSFCSHWNPKS